MLEAVAGQRGVVGLQVDLDLFVEPVAAQEAADRGGIEVARVLGRLARLGLDEDGARTADSVRLLDHPVHEAAHRVQLRADAPVQQGLVAFSPAPQHVVLAAELACGV